MNHSVKAFEAQRAHLFAVAYRMLGSRSDAEDILQEAFLRFSQQTDGVASTRAFLTTIVVRLCLDQMKSARARRELYVGPWLPEPLVSDQEPVAGPDARAELAESLSIAFLVLLERLSPLERAAFLLREVFDEPFANVASIVGTTEVAARQLVSRARAHIGEDKPRYNASKEAKQELLRGFFAACAAADASALGKLLARDVVAHSDGGGKVHAALKPIFGRDRVVRFLLGILQKTPPAGVPEFVWINGEPGIVVRDGTTAKFAVTLEVDDDAIANVWIMVSPDKLARAGQNEVWPSLPSPL